MDDLLVGGYGPDLAGKAAGIGLVRAHAHGVLEWRGTVADLPSPSWVTVGGGVVHAALEGTGEVASLGWVGGELACLARHPTAGRAPCHLRVDHGHLLVACYLTGEIGVHPLDARGAVGPLSQILAGSGCGPLPAQAGPHAHHVSVLDDGRILSADLGSDQLHLHRWVGDHLERTGSVGLPAGTGPRDVLVLPDGIVAMLGEWGCTITLLRPTATGLDTIATVRLPDARAGDQAAGLVCAPGGRDLYAGVRGSNRIAHIRRRGDTLTAVDSTATGDWPRSLLVHDGHVHVCNQRASSVTTYRLGADGALLAVGEVTIPSPTALVHLATRS